MDFRIDSEALTRNYPIAARFGLRASQAARKSNEEVACRLRGNNVAFIQSDEILAACMFCSCTIFVTSRGRHPAGIFAKDGAA